MLKPSTSPLMTVHQGRDSLRQKSGINYTECTQEANALYHPTVVISANNNFGSGMANSRIESMAS